MGYTIYIADDEENIRNLLKSFLESDGYTVFVFESGDALMEAFIRQKADLVILDIMMPGTDGLTVCKKLREYTNVPIIMLTAKDSEPDYIQGISLGCDNYITKPFRPTVLLMYVKALFRRIEMEQKSSYKRQDTDTAFGDLLYASEKNAVMRDGTAIDFSPTELKMFVYMMRNPEKAFSRNELLNVIWGFSEEVETRVTDETLRRIRKKLSNAGSNVGIRTVWGYGYRLEIAGT